MKVVFFIKLGLLISTFTFFLRANCQSGDSVWRIPLQSPIEDTFREDNLDKIEHLYLSLHFYHVADLPLEKMKNLKSLFLSNRVVDSIGLLLGKIAHLPNLKILDISGNIIQTLKFDKGTFPSLEYLSVNRCYVEFVDSSIKELKHLKYLNLGFKNSRMSVGNEIKSLPKTLMQLNNLETLVYENNGLAEVPKEICDLPRLTNLNLAGNLLTTLPDGLSALPLKVLKVSSNKLSEVPEVILALKQLQKLDIGHNNLRCIPVSLLEKKDWKK